MRHSPWPHTPASVEFEDILSSKHWKRSLLVVPAARLASSVSWVSRIFFVSGSRTQYFLGQQREFSAIPSLCLGAGRAAGPRAWERPSWWVVPSADPVEACELCWGRASWLSVETDVGNKPQRRKSQNRWKHSSCFVTAGLPNEGRLDQSRSRKGAARGWRRQRSWQRGHGDDTVFRKGEKPLGRGENSSSLIVNDIIARILWAVYFFFLIFVFSLCNFAWSSR